MNVIVFLNSHPQHYRVFRARQVEEKWIEGKPWIVITDTHYDDHSFPKEDVVKIECLIT